MKKMFAVMMVLLIITGCSNKPKTDDSNKTTTTTIKEDSVPKIKVNTNEKIVQAQTIDGLEFSNVSVITTDGITQIMLNITNTTEEDYTIAECKIIAKNIKGEVIEQIPSYIGDTITAGETKLLKSSIDVDLSNAYSLEYEIVR